MIPWHKIFLAIQGILVLVAGSELFMDQPQVTIVLMLAAGAVHILDDVFFPNG